MHKTLYSIEFDSVGNLLDVEFIVNFDNLEQSVQRNSESQLESTYKRYRIIKIQKQYSGTPEVLKQLVNKQSSSENHITKYEIVLSGKKESYRKKYELTTNSEGTVEEVVRIIPPEMNNLIY
ncbi:MAG: hypothetical protein U5L09_04310 [Bacteroidales bacterium]|nr:hypothetical protein [Bacteroidales bacterium]